MTHIMMIHPIEEVSVTEEEMCTYEVRRKIALDLNSSIYLFLYLQST
jgi:hypothetical protein